MSEAFLDRQHFLLSNLPQVTEKMREAKGQLHPPFGVVLDLRDFHARQFALACGLSQKEIDEDIANWAGKAIPTRLAVVSWDTVRVALPFTSPTATQTLDALWKVCQATGQTGVVAISAGGNQYANVSV